MENTKNLGVLCECGHSYGAHYGVKRFGNGVPIQSNLSCNSCKCKKFNYKFGEKIKEETIKINDFEERVISLVKDKDGFTIDGIRWVKEKNKMINAEFESGRSILTEFFVNEREAQNRYEEILISWKK